MTLVLALDTATLTASVAVVRDGAIVIEAETETGSHSERLMPLVAELMDRAGVGVAALDAIAVGAGPGSFTGLRIGLATAKGLAFASGKPLWLVSSLAALAWAMRAAPPGTLLVPALDARRGELYAGFYRLDGGGIPRAVAPERVLPPEQLAVAIAEARSACAGARSGDSDVTGVAIAGDALAAYGDALAALPPSVIRLAGVRATPPAAGVAVVAAAGDHADGLAHGAPAYLRPSEAEVKYPDGVPGALRRR